MTLEDELQRLAEQHKEGDIYVVEVDSGYSLSPQEWLRCLSPSQLKINTGTEKSGTESWILKVRTSLFGRSKATRIFRIDANPDRRGWAKPVGPDTYKLHFFEFDPQEDGFMSLCKREFAFNDESTVFVDADESDPNLCKLCFRKLHPEQAPAKSPASSPRKKEPLQVAFEDANQKLQDAVKEALPMFEEWGVRKDSLEEYWHTVYHQNKETGDVSVRFVPKRRIGEKQLASAKRAFDTIMREAQKEDSKITDRNEAERVLNILADALHYAGYERNEKGNWVQVAK